LNEPNKPGQFFQLFFSDEVGLKLEFQIISQHFFFTSYESLNFSDSSSSAQAINGYIEENTDGKLGNALDSNSISPLDRSEETESTYIDLTIYAICIAVT